MNVFRFSSSLASSFLFVWLLTGISSTASLGSLLGTQRRRQDLDNNKCCRRWDSWKMSLDDTNNNNGDEVVVTTRSTLTLLEHININVPNHDYCLDFYYRVLKCGMDPRKAANLKPGALKKTLWANCGASQFHLPYGPVGQVIPGQIGLRYDDDLHDLIQRLQSFPHCFHSFRILENGKCVHIVDKYGNQFYARQGCGTDRIRLSKNWKQPCILQRDTDQWGDIATNFGLTEEFTSCRGIEYVEFQCPLGTARGIASFYEALFEAPTTVLSQNNDDDEHDDDNNNGLELAIIGVGNISPQGRADQSLIFRETLQEQPIPEYDGHHIALYVGQTAQDFERAYENAEMAGVIWINPRFEDKANSLQTARKWKQFRFKNIIDVNTGDILYELEHEIRSPEHDAWPGPTLAETLPAFLQEKN